MHCLQAFIPAQIISASALIPPLALIVLLSAHSLLAEGRRAAENVFSILRVAFSMSVVAALIVTFIGPVEIVAIQMGSMKLGLLLDSVSTLMLTLVTFLGVIITKYSINYMEGDPGQARFSRWLCLTILSVIAIVVSNNLMVFALAWISTSLSLHKLLTFYPNRPSSRTAANKKFIISRLGDLCLIAAIILVWREFGSLDFHEIFSKSKEAHSTTISWICALLVATALIKSAQFPFHSWLPDTLETPTPVSALMHAGIINAGGFLIVRLSPLITQSPAALNALAAIGAFTALFASVIMMTKTSIKQTLAWSTIAQMGFMMMQCGLGAFALAMMHIVAHSLYKAHAFLRSGSIVKNSQSAHLPAAKKVIPIRLVAATLIIAAVLGSAIAAALGLRLQTDSGQLLLVSIYAAALAYLLTTLWNSATSPRIIFIGLIAAIVSATAWLALHKGFEHILSVSLVSYGPTRNSMEYVLMILIGLLFLALLLFQSQLPLWRSKPSFAKLYVHASNGFYVGFILNRLTQKATRAIPVNNQA